MTQSTQLRLTEANQVSRGVFSARFPQPVLVAIEVLAGHLEKRKRQPSDLKNTLQPLDRRGRPRWPRGYGSRRPERRVETLERQRAVPPGSRDIDPIMLVDRPIRDPYFFELRKSQREYPGKVLIGRVQPCDVLINDYTVSGRHAAFEYHRRTGTFLLTDLGSTNGTRVARKTVAPQVPTMIRSGTIIEFGRMKVRFLVAPDFYDWLVWSEALAS